MVGAWEFACCLERNGYLRDSWYEDIQDESRYRLHQTMGRKQKAMYDTADVGTPWLMYELAISLFSTEVMPFVGVKPWSGLRPWYDATVSAKLSSCS